MAVTLQQIAEECGVSRVTVDRALRGLSCVRPELAQRIRETARGIGYIPQHIKTAPDIEVLRPASCFLDSSLAERITYRALREVENLKGIYLATVGQDGVHRAIMRERLRGKVHVVVHDIVPENIQMVRNGVVDFIIGQDIRTQGSLPIQLMYRYLKGNSMPEQRTYLTEIKIKFRQNLMDEESIYSIYH